MTLHMIALIRVTNLIVKVFIVKLVVVELLHLIVVLESFASEIVDGSWDDLVGKQKFASASWSRL
jgi:hypothetical protein